GMSRCLFFFQAEDGIRDRNVTGVQTCALPISSEFAYVRVDQDADWSEVTCEDGLDFSRFETVDCAATTADGTSWDLVVAPGTYADNDQGLLVGIDRTSAG